MNKLRFRIYLLLLLVFAFAPVVRADGLSFSGITAAVDATTAVAAITAIAAIKVAPGFAKWAYGKVIGWFK